MACTNAQLSPSVGARQWPGWACALRDGTGCKDAVSAGQCRDNPPAPYDAGGTLIDVHCRLARVAEFA